jgi:hypothetical protein
MNNRVSITRSVKAPHRYVTPFNDGEYVLLLVICDPDIPADVQDAISDQIVKTGCRYALCFGFGCSTWDTSIDSSSLRANTPDERFIMTTWHDDEPIEDVVDFWWWNTTFDDYVPENFGVFIIGSDTELEDRITKRIEYHQR